MHIRHVRWIIFFVVLLAVSSLSFAAPLRQLRFDRLDVDHGLAHESVLAIVQDGQGYMWLGGQSGLTRYNGYKMTVYKHSSSDQGSLSNNWVQALYVDERGSLWVGTQQGLNQYDPFTDSFKKIGFVDPKTMRLGAQHIKHIVGDGKGGMWLGTDYGLFHLDSGMKNSKHYLHNDTQKNSLASNQINALARDEAGNLWVGSAEGLSLLPVRSEQFQHYSLSASELIDAEFNIVRSLLISKDKSIWVGTLAGLEQWSLVEGGKKINRRRFGPAENLPFGPIIALLQDMEGNHWVGMRDEGLFRWDATLKRFMPYRHVNSDTHSLSENTLTGLYQDRSGSLWVGTWSRGVNRVDLGGSGFGRLMRSQGDGNWQSSNRIFGITGDGKGNLWVASSSGLASLDPGSGESRFLRGKEDAFSNVKFSAQEVSDVLRDQDDSLWVATHSGLFHINPITESYVHHNFGSAAGNHLNKILIGSEKELWLASRGGLHRFDTATREVKTWKQIAGNNDSLGHDIVRTLLEDRQGMLWIGTDAGLDRFDPKTGHFRHYRHKEGDPTSLPSDRITHLYEADEYTLWVATSAGLSEVRKATDELVTFRTYSVEDGLASSTVSAILPGMNDQLWVSTEVGISRFDTKSGKFTNYDRSMGTIEGGYQPGTAYQDADGSLYFGGVDGFSAFRPESLHQNTKKPRVVITDFQIFSQSVRGAREINGFSLKEPIEVAKGLTLPYNHSVFSIEFSAMHYANSQRNIYSYQLRGFDNDWVRMDAGKHFVTYTNLYPGEYEFIVKAANSDGVWVEKPTTLKLTITPPYWQTWPFRIAGVLLLLTAIYLIYHIRVRQLTRQRQILEEEVTARTAEVVHQKELVEVKNREVEQKNALLEVQKREVELRKQEAERQRAQAELKRAEAEEQREETERQKVEVERQKEIVEVSNRHISVLSEIGREITATLERTTIMESVYRHVHELVEVDRFFIALYDQEDATVEFCFVMDKGVRRDLAGCSAYHPRQLIAWCITNGVEVFINDIASELCNYFEDHQCILNEPQFGISPYIKSLIFVPILLKGRVLGVLSVQSMAADTYLRVHLDMILSLASYASVALDNSDAYLQLKAAQKQVAFSEKMASLGTLTAGVAHEINNPTNFAHVGAQTLLNDLGKFRNFLLELAGEDADKEVVDDLNNRINGLEFQISTIVEGTTRIKNLVLDLRTFSRLDQAEKKAVLIADSLRSTVNLVRIKYSDVAEIKCDLQANPTLECWPAELNQVFMNLIVNACQAIQSKREANPSTELGLLLIRSKIDNDHLVFEFEDNGCGMTQEVMHRIYEPFFTTKTVGEGTGLGLAITFGIIEKHKGQINVTSEVGKGTCFKLLLPLFVELE